MSEDSRDAVDSGHRLPPRDHAAERAALGQRFVWEEGDLVVLTPCHTCRHEGPLRATPDGPRLTCAAFPAGIPDPILEGDHDHHTPYPGDHGIQYAPKPLSAQRRQGI